MQIGCWGVQGYRVDYHQKATHEFLLTEIVRFNQTKEQKQRESYYLIYKSMVIKTKKIPSRWNVYTMRTVYQIKQKGALHMPP